MANPAQVKKPAQDLIVQVKKAFAENPNARQAAALRRKLLDDPDDALELSDLNVFARRAALAPLEPRQREAVLLRAEAMQGYLGHKESQLLERLLIEQVVTCWLHLELAQALYGASALTTLDPGMARALERRVAGAQRRYFKAMDALLDLRRSWTPRGRWKLSAGPKAETPQPADDEQEDVEEDEYEEGDEDAENDGDDDDALEAAGAPL